MGAAGLQSALKGPTGVCTSGASLHSKEHLSRGEVCGVSPGRGSGLEVACSWCLKSLRPKKNWELRLSLVRTFVWRSQEMFSQASVFA